MGRLVLFGRSLDVALDDLYVPSTYGIFFSTIWLTLAVASYCTVHFGPCEWSWHLRTYVLSYMVVLTVDFPTNLVVLLLSMSGTIAKEGPRVWLTPIAHFHMGLTVVTWLVHIYGLWVMNNPREYEPLTPDCPADHTYSLHILIQSALIWAFIIHIFWTFFVVLMMMGSKNPITQSFERYYQLWKKRLRWLTCGAYRELNNGKNVMGEVAKELAHYFHDIDWAPSDILIGIILLKRDQRRQRYEQSKRRAHVAFRAKQLAEVKKREEEVEKEAERRKRKSSGGTTAINHFGSSRATPELAEGRSSPPMAGNGPITFRLSTHEDGSASASATPAMPSVLENGPEPVADSTVLYADLLPKAEDIADVLYFYRYAELAYTQSELKQLAPEMIVYHSSANDLFKSPFFIALDHEAEAVILAIRGTYSAADVLVDLRYAQSAIVIEELREMGCPPLQMVHSGMLETSQVVLTDAAHHLRTLFNDPASRCLNYRLVVCGHSLGAGVAAVTTLLLRQSDFASAICFAYAPPGCLLSPQAAEYFEQFCISVVIGDDMVPRVSRNSMEVMKWDVGRLLSTAQMAKWQVLGSVLGNQCCGAGERQRRKRRKRMIMMRQQLKAQEEEKVRLRRQELDTEMEKLQREYATPMSSLERKARRSPNPADETRSEVLDESEDGRAEASETNNVSRRPSDHTLAAMSADQIRQPVPAASTTLVRSDSIASQAGSIAVAGPSSPKPGSMLRRSNFRQASKTQKLHKMRLAERSLAQPERAVIADNVGWTMRRSRKLQERRRSSLGDMTNNFGPMTTKDGKPLNKWVARIMALRKTNPSFAGHGLRFGRTEEEGDEVEMGTKSLGGGEDDIENRATLPSSQMFLPGRVLYLEKLRRDWDFDENGVEFSLSANAGVPGLVDTAGVGSGFGLALGGSPVFGLYAAGTKEAEGNVANNDHLESNPPTNQPSDTVSPPQPMAQVSRVDNNAEPSTQSSDFVTASTDSSLPVHAANAINQGNLTPKNASIGSVNQGDLTPKNASIGSGNRILRSALSNSSLSRGVDVSSIGGPREHIARTSSPEISSASYTSDSSARNQVPGPSTDWDSSGNEGTSVTGSSIHDVHHTFEEAMNHLHASLSRSRGLTSALGVRSILQRNSSFRVNIDDQSGSLERPLSPRIDAPASPLPGRAVLPRDVRLSGINPTWSSRPNSFQVLIGMNGAAVAVTPASPLDPESHEALHETLSRHMSEVRPDSPGVFRPTDWDATSLSHTLTSFESGSMMSSAFRPHLRNAGGAMGAVLMGARRKLFPAVQMQMRLRQLRAGLNGEEIQDRGRVRFEVHHGETEDEIEVAMDGHETAEAGHTDAEGTQEEGEPERAPRLMQVPRFGNRRTNTLRILQKGQPKVSRVIQRNLRKLSRQQKEKKSRRWTFGSKQKSSEADANKDGTSSGFASKMKQRKMTGKKSMAGTRSVPDPLGTNFSSSMTVTLDTGAGKKPKELKLDATTAVTDVKGSSKYVYRPRWAAREEFMELVISSTSIKDHFRFGLFRVLEKKLRSGAYAAAAVGTGVSPVGLEISAAPEDAGGTEDGVGHRMSDGMLGLAPLGLGMSRLRASPGPMSPLMAFEEEEQLVKDEYDEDDEDDDEDEKEQV